jgi:ligand-binding sensor domain-containing protein
MGSEPPLTNLATHKSEIGLPLAQGHSYKEFNSQGQIWTINQDRRGLMYIGVSGGDLIEYDGVTWRKISTGSDTVRSLAFDEAGRLWLGCNGTFGYVEPDTKGSLHFVSLLDKVPENERQFTDVWQTLVTPQGVFFRSYEKLFRWSDNTIHVWSHGERDRYQALSAVRGHVYTAQNHIGLEEIIGDELRPVAGGNAYKDAAKLFLYPYDEKRVIVSQREGYLSLYDGEKVTPFPTQVDTYLKQHKVYTSILLRDGSICVTTLDGGAILLTHDGKLRQFLNVQDGLLDSNALSAYEDRDGAVWIGTSTGVTRFEVNSPVSFFDRTPGQDAVRFQGSIYVTEDTSGSPVKEVASDPITNRPDIVSIPGPTQAFIIRVFHDPAHKKDQLLAATSDGVMVVSGKTMAFAMPGTHGPTEQSYSLLQSRKNPSRVFIGHSDGVGSMRWDGQKWIDEGRLPIVYQARTFAEDEDGSLWAAGGNGQVVHATVAASGMRESKVEFVGNREGLPAGPNSVARALGSVWVGVDRNQNLYRWDRNSSKFVVDNRAALPIDAPDGSAGHEGTTHPRPAGQCWDPDCIWGRNCSRQ